MLILRANFSLTLISLSFTVLPTVTISVAWSKDRIRTNAVSQSSYTFFLSRALSSTEHNHRQFNSKCHLNSDGVMFFPVSDKNARGQ